MAKRLPRKIYIRWNTDVDDPYLEASTDPKLLGEFHQGQNAGEYKLVKKVNIKHTTEIKDQC